MSVVLINIHNGEWISLEFLNHWIEFKLLILWLSQDFPSSYFVWQIHSSLGIIPLSRLCLYMRQLILCDKMLIEFTIAPMDRGAWWATVHGVAKSRTRLNDFTFTFHFPALEKAMATHCSCLENPRDGGAWWAAIYGVAQSRTRLKRLSSCSSSSTSLFDY